MKEMKPSAMKTPILLLALALTIAPLHAETTRTLTDNKGRKIGVASPFLRRPSGFRPCV